MRPTKTLTATLATLTFAIVSCEEKTAETTGTEKTPAAHDHSNCNHDHGDKNDHKDHDHDGDDHDHEGHNHDGDDHGDHDHAKKVAGPNGGRVITDVEPHAEFFVTADRKVRITFLGADNKPVAVDTQSVNIVCGDRSNPTMLNPAKEADGMSLLSAGTLPEGNNFPTIITFKATSDAAPVRTKFTLNMSNCPSCEYLEYACTCDHSHGHSH